MKHLQKGFINKLIISQKDYYPFGEVNPVVAMQDDNAPGTRYTHFCQEARKEITS